MGDIIRRVAVFTGNRAEYGLLRPVIKELADSLCFEVYLIISGSHLSKKYGKTINEIDLEGINGVFEISFDDENKPCVSDLFSKIVKDGAECICKIQPHFALVAGDRYETFAMAVAAFYNNVPIAHVFGGDLSQGGHQDDSVRHCITKLAHLHFTTNEDSYNRVIGLGEEPWRVFNVGSPAVDNIKNGNYAKPEEIEREFSFDLKKPIIVYTQHPVTTESEKAYDQAKESLLALEELGYQTIITYPCNDNGSEDIIRAIHEFEGNHNFRIRKNLGGRLYLGCLNTASCVVGNSSSGLLETPIFKIPCVNIGTRQAGRLRAENVIDVPYDRQEIKNAILKALNDNVFREIVRNSSNYYGNGRASKNIVNILQTVELGKGLIQKKMSY